MSSHDGLDDVLLEIKKKKVAAVKNPAREEADPFYDLEPDLVDTEAEQPSNVLEFSRNMEPVHRDYAEGRKAPVTTIEPKGTGWGQEISIGQELSSPPDTRKTERISRQLAQQSQSLPAAQRGQGGRSLQDQQLDALWQSVTVKKKKPELYDFEAEEREYPQPPATAPTPRPARQAPPPPAQDYRQQPRRQAEPPRDSLWEDTARPAQAAEPPVYTERRPAHSDVQESFPGASTAAATPCLYRGRFSAACGPFYPGNGPGGNRIPQNPAVPFKHTGIGGGPPAGNSPGAPYPPART